MLTVPNIQQLGSGSVGFAGQCIGDDTDDWARQAAFDGTGVISGCQVTAQSSPNMTVQVAAGSVVVAGVVYAVGATASLAIGAATASGDRRDAVVYTVGTGVQVIASAASVASTLNPTVKPSPPGGASPAIPANSVLLGEVYVAQATVSVASTNITDKTAVVGNVSQVVAKTANYAVVTADAPNVITFNGSNLVATLPSSAQSDGWHVQIMNLNASQLEITPNGLNINEATTPIYLSQYQIADVRSDGSNYFTGFSTPSVGSVVSTQGTAGTALSTTAAILASLTLGNGTWLVSGSVSVTGNTTAGAILGLIFGNGTATSTFNGSVADAYANSTGTTSVSLTAICVVTVAGTISMDAKITGSGGSPVSGAAISQPFSAVRVA